MGADDAGTVPVPPGPGEREYVRPAMPESIYRSPDGTLIPYGHRWGDEGPATDSYSVISHPERFAGLRLVAHALIGYLAATYEVDIDDDPACAADLLRQIEGVQQSVRVKPRNPEAAPMTFVFLEAPGVIVHAGVLHDFAFPACGCDACDETASSQADRLELLVLAVAAGGYSESYPVGRRRWVAYSLAAADGSARESGQGDPGSVPRDRLRSARGQLGHVPAGWLPWPRRRG
jgi:hypothetical protein